MKRRLIPALLAGCFAVLAVAGPAAAQAPPPELVLSHFHCKFTSSIGPPFGTVTLVLEDQFGAKTEEITSSTGPNLCAPADKIVPPGVVHPRLFPFAHLVCYRIADGLTPPVATVRVANQFGEDTLELGPRERLCVPSAKFRPPEPPPPPLFIIEDVLDHFACYPASGTSVPPPVVVVDQFASGSYQFGPAVELCNPVLKIHAPRPPFIPRRPFAHLVCYQHAFDEHGGASFGFDNQIGLGSAFTFFENRHLLCVPSTKDETPPPREPQHFAGYETNTGTPRLPSETLTLVDQFTTETVRRAEPRLLMTPVEKRRPGRDPSPIERPDEHLKCYSITGGARQDRTVRVSNQLGDSSLLVKEPNRLCAPALKSLTGPPSGNPEDTQHYKCYRVDETPRFFEAGVGLRDQFGSLTVDVGAAELLCNPVEKRRAGRPPELPPRPEEHLVCYDVVERSTFVSLDAFTADQFGSQRLRVIDPDLLCVPSEKLP